MFPKVGSQEGQQFKMATAIWQVTGCKAQTATDQGRKDKTVRTTRRKEETQILQLITFSGNREQKKIGEAPNISEPQSNSTK